MKKVLLASLLICIFLSIAGCSRKEYDISENFNTEITLFQDEISVPIGSIGPITIGSTLNGLSAVPGIGGMVAEYIKVDADGFLVLETKGDVFRSNVYEIEKAIGDVSASVKWNSGYQSGFVGGMAGALGMLGLKVTNQKLTISTLNPLWEDVHASCGATYGCMGNGGSYSAPIPALDDVTMVKGKEAQVVAIDIPTEVTSPVTAISFANMVLDLPANPVSNLSDTKGNLFFAFTYNYKCGISTGETLSFPISNITTGKINLPIGQFKLKKCQIQIEVENTIPLAVTANNIRVLFPRESKEEEAEVDDNIVVDADVNLDGGSLEDPAISTITLTIEALQGTIPDIPELMLDLNLAAQPGMGSVPLSAKQGIYVKSSSAVLTGGITLGGNGQKDEDEDE